MNIVKGISALAMTVIMIVFMSLVGVVLAEYFGSWAIYILPTVGILMMIYGLADSHQQCSLEKELQKEGLSDQSIESVKKGLQQSAEGKTHDLGSFAQYANQEEYEELVENKIDEALSKLDPRVRKANEDLVRENKILRQAILEANTKLKDTRVEIWEELYEPIKILNEASSQPIATEEEKDDLRQGILNAYLALSNLNGEIPVEAWKKLYEPMKILREAYNEPILTEEKDD